MDVDYDNAQGLYVPSMEKDACGVGMVANIDGEASHEIVEDALEALCRLEHRGACCDGDSGDGAGITLGMPDDYIRNIIVPQMGADAPLPRLGKYACGLVFLPRGQRNEEKRRTIKAKLEDLITECGQMVFGWWPVERNSKLLNGAAKQKEPDVEMLFVVPWKGARTDERTFDKWIYMIRKRAASAVGKIPDDDFYICSLNTRTLVYKGQLTSNQLREYYSDLQKPEFKSHMALVHSRYSTNTFPSWQRAQPLRYMCHNGEINTLRGNKNWMSSREASLKSDFFNEEQMQTLLPIIGRSVSDSGSFDNVLEFLVRVGDFNLSTAMLLMQPEAWENDGGIVKSRRALYDYMSCIMEPWDGPALIAFTDGQQLGAKLDRNGLRPARYWILKDRRVILSSEVGVVDVEPNNILQKGRLSPGQMFLIDFVKKRTFADGEVKDEVAATHDFSAWISESSLRLSDMATPQLPESPYHCVDIRHVNQRLVAAGYTTEHLEMLLLPMGTNGIESLGSMGNDRPLAILSQKPRTVYDYFKQLFAQVTNPPIDPIRESVGMSLACYVGPTRNLLRLEKSHCQKILLDTPVLGPEEYHKLLHLDDNRFPHSSIDTTFALEGESLSACLDRICTDVLTAVEEGSCILVLSDRRSTVAPSQRRLAVPSLVAVGCVHQFLLQKKLRGKVVLLVESSDAKEVHHHCLLFGFGADATFPYLAYAALNKLKEEGTISKDYQMERFVANYRTACSKGILKVMAKMGICTMSSYKGAQIFEAVGLGPNVMKRCFAGSISRIGGIDFPEIENDIRRLYAMAYITDPKAADYQRDLAALPSSGDYHWRITGEVHMNTPNNIATLQEAARKNSRKAYRDYAKDMNNSLARQCTLRGLFDLNEGEEIDIDDVEPAANIVKRFQTGAMSYGSISKETHESIAIAMNKLGAKSNTGEGGEDPARFSPEVNGNSKRSAIKQVASGRFGVTIDYLSNADEIQIKMAQGAKPGEGGELPGGKVTETIAKTRFSTPGVGLISPPPHHDIYSIEDLKQLIHDLKNANPSARINVKLVSEAGVGVVAAGVAKAGAHTIMVSGHDGGTGAAVWTGIHNCGLPWELGVAEAQQTLVMNGLRGSVVLQTDGQMKTGRDVVIGALLGAEEFGFSTAPLIALGCIMMRKCHLNTCPVGIATTDPELRKKFQGQPEHIINFFFMVAEEVREIMAILGFHTFDEMIGRVDMLRVKVGDNIDKLAGLDLSAILRPSWSFGKPGTPLRCKTPGQVANLLPVDSVDEVVIREIRDTILSQGNRSSTADIKDVTPYFNKFVAKNVERAMGTRLSHKVATAFGPAGLPANTIHLMLTGSAGQSMGAWLCPGITMELEGDGNDAVAKGLCGGKIVVYPYNNLREVAESQVIIGNVALYGATSGKAFFNGIAAERFAVRNSGAHSVVEGVGDHGCEYMTGGRVVIIGETGLNFASGMTGGIAYVYDETGMFHTRCHKGTVTLDSVFADTPDEKEIRNLLEEHIRLTGSPKAKRLIAYWGESVGKFVKVFPNDYRKYLEMNAEKITEEAEKAKRDAERAKRQGPGAIKDIEDLRAVSGVTEKAQKMQKSRPATKALYPLSSRNRLFFELPRESDHYRDAHERVRDFDEIYVSSPKDENRHKSQAGRCMDCGTPFCQSSSGCPVNNLIPEWNELVYRDQWHQAYTRLKLTNNFPEFTGRICPAPCEGACVAGLVGSSVTIKNIEWAIIDRAFKEGWVVPSPPKIRTDKNIAIVGSGPGGLAAADQLNKLGHNVTVYERDPKIGGLMVYGIPGFKLSPSIVDRRVDLLRAEGVKFLTNSHIGEEGIDPADILEQHDAILLATGATIPRDVKVPGRHFSGIHYAMDYLHEEKDSSIDVSGKKVVVIGAGDTGCDVIAKATRQKAATIVNFALYHKPPETRSEDNPWPSWPKIARVDYGHEEAITVYGADPREYSVVTKEFIGNQDGSVTGVSIVRANWVEQGGRRRMEEIPGSEEIFDADIVFLAIGFTGPERSLPVQLGVPMTPRGNVQVRRPGSFETLLPGVFAAGDCRRGQSLVVHAIKEGREAASQMDTYLHKGVKSRVTLDLGYES